MLPCAYPGAGPSAETSAESPRFVPPAKQRAKETRTRALTMQICYAMKFLRIAAVPAISIIIGVPAFVSARAQAKPSTAPAALPPAPPVQLQPYTAQDQSVSAGVPSGWNVKNAAAGQINMSGTQGEAINVDVFVAQDGTFQSGQQGPGGAGITMPSSAKLTDKLAMFVQ